MLGSTIPERVLAQREKRSSRGEEGKLYICDVSLFLPGNLRVKNRGGSRCSVGKLGYMKKKPSFKTRETHMRGKDGENAGGEKNRSSCVRTAF